MDRFLKIIGSTLLATFLVVGCANNDQDPPPEDDDLIDDTNDMDDDLDMDNDVNEDGDGPLDDNNGTDGFRNGTDGTDNGTDGRNGNNGINKNVPGDADPTQNGDTPAEDIIEDGLDLNDENNNNRSKRQGIDP